MSDLQGIADRVEVEALPGEYTDAAMTRDYDRFASLFTPAPRCGYASRPGRESLDDQDRHHPGQHPPQP